jgi:hypothetical protein
MIRRMNFTKETQRTRRKKSADYADFGLSSGVAKGIDTSLQPRRSLWQPARYPFSKRNLRNLRMIISSFGA